jgi:hypothetical protein
MTGFLGEDMLGFTLKNSKELVYLRVKGVFFFPDTVKHRIGLESGRKRSKAT